LTSFLATREISSLSTEAILGMFLLVERWGAA
jgi:hypothetical protein